MPKKPTHDPNQRELDFERGAQLRLLRAPLPDSVEIVEGKASRCVLASTMRSVLKEIDDFARDGLCWASAKTIAENLNFNERTVRRATRALESLSLICKTRKWSATAGRVLNHYNIVWSELAVREARFKQQDQTDPVTRPNGPNDQTKRTRGTRPNGPGVQNQADPGSDKTPKETPKETLTPPHPQNHAGCEGVRVLEFSKAETTSTDVAIGVASTDAHPASTDATDSDSPTWFDVEGMLATAGIQAYRRVTKDLRQRVSIAHVLAIVKFFNEQPTGAYGPNALYCRLVKAHPCVSPEDGWPKPRSQRREPQKRPPTRFDVKLFVQKKWREQGRPVGAVLGDEIDRICEAKGIT